MPTFKEELKQSLCEQRKLTPSTCNTYASLLVSLQKKLNKDEPTLSFYTKDTDEIIRHIEALEKAQTKKTLLSALFVLTGEDSYRAQMMQYVREVNDHYKKQKTDPDRLKHLKSFEEIKTIHQQIKNQYKQTMSHQHLMDLIISSVCSGCVEGLPPRRIKDYADMKVRGYNRETDNYYEKGQFVFNAYKTAKKHGKQTVQVPKEIITLCNKAKKTSLHHYLLSNESFEPYTESALSKKVKRMFQGNSQDVLRSIYLSHIYKDVPAVSFLQDTADKMGHTIDSALSFYVKKD